VAVFDKVSHLSVDLFQPNRRLSETHLNRPSTISRDSFAGSRSETHSIAQSPPHHHKHHHHRSSLESSNLSLDLDNPFQNDQLPLWQGQNKQRDATMPTNYHSTGSSPDNNNYGYGQDKAYSYQSLNETPPSPELATHRMMQQTTSTTSNAADQVQPPEGTPEIIQVLHFDDHH
jgi:hypothetical protein